MCIRKDYPDTMWHMMSHSTVKPDPGYVYSDIDFYIMQKIVEQVSGKALINTSMRIFTDRPGVA